MAENPLAEASREYRQEANRIGDRASWYMATGSFLAMAYTVSVATGPSEHRLDVPSYVVVLFFIAGMCAFLKSYLIAARYSDLGRMLHFLGETAKHEGTATARSAMDTAQHAVEPAVEKFRKVSWWIDGVVGVVIFIAMLGLLHAYLCAAASS